MARRGHLKPIEDRVQFNVEQPLASKLRRHMGVPREGIADKHPPRGTGAWYRRLAEYCLEFRQRIESYWDEVDKAYHDTRIERLKWEMAQLSEITPGRAYNLVHTIQALVLSSRPTVFLRGTSGKIEEEKVPLLEQLLNAVHQEDYQLFQALRGAVLDCSKYSHGGVYLTYDSKDFAAAQRDTSDDPALKAAAGAVAADAANLPSETPERPTGFEGDDRILHETVGLIHIPCRDLILDPAASGAAYDETCRYVGRRIYADPDIIWNSLGLEGKMSEEEWEASIDGNLVDSDDPYGQIELYEIYERTPSGKWKRVLVPAKEGEPLAENDDPLVIGHPFRILEWNDEGKGIYDAQSDLVQVWTEMLAERMIYTKAVQAHGRQVEDLYAIDEGAATKQQLVAMTIPDIGKVIKLNAAGKPIANVFTKIQKDVRSPEALNLLGALERAIQISSGLSPSHQGLPLRSDASATEASQLAGFTQARMEHKIVAVDTFVASVTQGILGLMAQFYDAARIREIAGADAADMWAEASWTPRDTQLNFKVVVHPGSMQQVNPQLRLAQMLQILQLVNSDPGLRATVNQEPVINEMFRSLGVHADSKVLLGSGEDLAEVNQGLSLLGGAGGGTGRAGGSPPRTPAEAFQGAQGVAQ